MKMQNDSKQKSLRVTPPIDYSINPYPVGMSMSLNNTCNHRCVMCQYRKVVPKPVRMEREKGRCFLEQGYRLMGGRKIGFGLIDEPFMSDLLEDFVLDAKKTGFEYVFLDTNGSLAVKDRMYKLFSNGLDSIKFSVNAGKAETYQKVHGRDDFQKVIDNIRIASELRSSMKADTAIFVSFVENIFNTGEEAVLETLLTDKVDKIYAVKAANQGGEMYEEIRQNIISKTGAIWNAFDRYNNICPYPFGHIKITAEGYLNACCLDLKNEMVVADLNKMPLDEAWNCDTIKTLRMWHLENRIPKNCKCYNCINCTNNDVIPLNRLVSCIK